MNAMNWGWKIVIGYCGFVAMILALVFLSTAQTFHLVTPHYYQKEQGWDDRLERVKNSKALSEPVRISISQEKQAISIEFPASFSFVQGEIELYRPTDATQDLRIDVQTDPEGHQLIPMNEMASGLWRIRINWMAEDVPYYDEQVLIIPEQG